MRNCWFAFFRSLKACQRTVLQRGLPDALQQIKEATPRVIKTAWKLTGSALPSLEETEKARYLSNVLKTPKNSCHTGYLLFDLFPTGRRYSSTKTEANSSSPNSSRVAVMHHDTFYLILCSFFIHNHSLSSTERPDFTVGMTLLFYCVNGLFLCLGHLHN